MNKNTLYYEHISNGYRFVIAQIGYDFEITHIPAYKGVTKAQGEAYDKAFAETTKIVAQLAKTIEE